MADAVAEERYWELPKGTWGAAEWATPTEPKKASNQSALLDSLEAGGNRSATKSGGHLFCIL